MRWAPGESFLASCLNIGLSRVSEQDEPSGIAIAMVVEHPILTAMGAEPLKISQVLDLEDAMKFANMLHEAIMMLRVSVESQEA